MVGTSWPGDASTSRAVAPPVGAGDAVALYYSQTRSRQEAGLFLFQGIREEEIMARTTDRKTGTKRAAIYARVSDKSQDTEEKTSISEQISDMEAHCERRGLTITARYQEVGTGLVEEPPRVPADAGRRQKGTLRHHRLLEVRPPQPGHVPRRRPHGGHRGVPDRVWKPSWTPST